MSRAKVKYRVTPPEYEGELPVKVELFSEPFNPHYQREFRGWKFEEITGVCIANPRPRGWLKFRMWLRAKIARLFRISK